VLVESGRQTATRFNQSQLLHSAEQTSIKYFFVMHATLSMRRHTRIIIPPNDSSRPAQSPKAGRCPGLTRRPGGKEHELLGLVPRR
jgi:hypothetical protein